MVGILIIYGAMYKYNVFVANDATQGVEIHGVANDR
jgi:hypothetical protein